jgi:predicted ATPase/signal transduction histidine kinase
MKAISNLLGYQITQQLYAGTRTLVYRAIRTDDQQPVVIKLLRNEYPTFNEIVQFRNQYTIAKNFNFPSVIQPLTLETYHNSYALVMKDFGGVSLSDYLKIATDESQNPKSLPLAEFLNIAIQLTDILHYLYQNRVIHKDIKPANILINPDTKQIKLIDFSISSLLPRETQEIQNPNILEGTLAYLSPEQTGRMNRGIDYRSDFYSLGVTFYELLTGELPFVSADAMELVHCHLAKHPISIHQINPQIPLALSEIVSKLMAKNAENRYQTAWGIKQDLEICLEQLQRIGNIESFKLGERDISDRFTIPEKLYGRENEVNQLLAAFERVSTGHTEMMLVAGFSGIGKTAAVNEVHKPIVRQRGYFIKGKYDQFNRNIPFSAFVQAFRDLMGQLLSESDEQLQAWKNQILAAVGDNGQVLTEVIPELENIIGKQSPVTELPGSAAQNRFNLLFQKFVKIFTSKEHPLVIFLDDLQWADSASLNLLKLLLQETGYLLVLGAYRDNEVSPVHPFILTVNEIVKTGVNVNKVTLPPLSEPDMNLLIADTLNCELSLAQPLTKLVYQKTQGNPFFATQFLKALHDDKLISFDWDIQHWQCDIAQVKALAIADDVVEFMALQLQKLPTQTQDMLKSAACIGAEFDLNTLVIVSEQSAGATATALWKALQEGLVIPTTRIYKFFTQLESEEAFNSSANPTYRFLHDRVQQAAYSLIPESERAIAHYHIGQLLLQKISPETREYRIFELVNQLNYGTALITEQTERDELAKLNLIACRKARVATAYKAAREYAAVGLSLLGENTWQQQYEMSLGFYELAAEVAMLCGDFEAMEQFIDLVIQQTYSLLEQVNIYRIRIQAKTSQRQLSEVLEIGINLLQKLGLTINESPTPEDIQQSVQAITELIGDRKITDFVYLPVMTDANKIAITQIASSIMSAIYTSGSPLYSLLAALLVKLFLQHGNISVSSTNYACYSVVLCNMQQNIDLAAQFGQLALNVVSKFDDKASKPEVFLLLGFFILHRKSHLKETLPLLSEGYILGLEVGNLEYAGYNANTFCRYSFWCGQPLANLERETHTYYNTLVQLKQLGTANYCLIYWQVILNLMGFAEHPTILSGSALQETEFLPFLRSANDLYGLFVFHSYKLTLCFLFGEVEQANNHVLECKNYFMGCAGTIGEPVFYFYDSLIAISQLSQPSSDISTVLERVAQNQTQLQLWAHHAPMNHQHKVDLVEAEKYRVLGKTAEAIEFYDKAISGAKANEYIQEEALANELAAKFYLDWGKQRIAQEYMTEAYYGYARWGAKAKVADLETRYPQLLAPILQQTRSPFSTRETIFALGTVTSTSGATSSSSVSDSLDLTAILKASQTMSGEIELEKLVSALLSIVIENAGADKCVFMLMREDLLLVKGSITEGTEPVVLQRVPVEESQDIPLKLIYKVKHSHQTIVLLDATADPTLTNDSYIVRQQPKSILCSPILHQGKLKGILYLENNLAVGAFTSDRIEVLNLICAQAAISLENARLYQAAQQALNDLKQAQLTIVQSEKMSALGNLVAGVAHEINNPVGFLNGNIQPALDYISDIFQLFDLVQEKYPQLHPDIQEEIENIELDYIREDLPKLVSSMQEGVNRIKDISTSLRTFSRADTNYPVACNIHDGIDSTIMILKHRLKANENRPEIQVIKDYGNLPQIECYAGQLNQVFMNLLSNAIDALEESNQGRKYAKIANKITVKTELSEDKKQVIIRIKDNGIGMSAEVQAKIFEHLFTTKGVGKGTGLGLAIARQIIEEKHRGKIEVNSSLNSGTEFIILLPIKEQI